VSDFWTGRGQPWEHDPGPAKNRAWAGLFAATPNYRGLSKAVLGREGFRWHFGPMFYRGRLTDGDVKVLVIGQEGAQDESLGHRSFVGGTGARMQHVLNHLGITRSYLFLNTFVYPIYGQYNDDLRPLAQDPDSPIVEHRHRIFDEVLARNDLRLVIAVGTAAKESVVTWIKSHGGTCPSGASDVSKFTPAGVLGPRTRAVGVLHPGGASKGGSTTAIIADFKRALGKIDDWADADPAWLPPDTGESRKPASAYKYSSAPIPFRDLPFGTTWRVGRGATSSNRKDNQRSIQIFSAAGRYNGEGASLSYSSTATGSNEGYAEEAADVPYEPPKKRPDDHDPGPSAALARLLMGGAPGLAWPDFAALGVRAHPSFGTGPIYRGRLSGVSLYVIADQEAPDDLFTGRAMTGDAGQRFQSFLTAAGLTKRYTIVRVAPVDTLDLTAAQQQKVTDDPKLRAIHQAVLDAVDGASPSLAAVVAVGPNAVRLAGALDTHGHPVVAMKAWVQTGAKASWQQALTQLSQLTYPTDVAATFSFDGKRGQIPRIDLPYGTLRWQGSSGDRGVRAKRGGTPSPDYLKVFMPSWAFQLLPPPLTAAEQAKVDDLG
jgi:uracil-DNA glycosylase